jgi:arylesterase/paraoxonase
MLRRIVLPALLLIVLVVAGRVGLLLWRAGTFRSIAPHFAGNCRLVKGAVGPEDLTIHPRTGIALISAADRRADMRGEAVPGAIYAYDLAADEARLVNLTPDADVAFQPHGLSLWTGQDGRDVLFVVNHPPASTGLPADTVEVFDYEGGRLVHRRRLTDPSLVMLNDLVAVGPGRFYVTRTHRHPPGWRQTLETWLQQAAAEVLHYGPDGFRVALDGLVYPNGVNVSPDGRTLYVASVTEYALRVHDRDPETDALTLRDVWTLPGGPDNIEIDAEGELWIGAHPKLLRVRAHAADAGEPSPSQVLRVSPAGAVQEVYLSDGAAFSGSSVAAVRGRRLLVGKIFDDGFLDCTMP